MVFGNSKAAKRGFKVQKPAVKKSKLRHARGATARPAQYGPGAGNAQAYYDNRVTR